MYLIVTERSYAFILSNFDIHFCILSKPPISSFHNRFQYIFYHSFTLSPLASQYSIESIIPTKTIKTAGASSAMLSDVLCPMPSTVTRVSVKNGDVVKKGDLLLVVEAMKMEVGLLRLDNDMNIFIE